MGHNYSIVIVSHFKKIVNANSIICQKYTKAFFGDCELCIPKIRRENQIWFSGKNGIRGCSETFRNLRL